MTDHSQNQPKYSAQLLESFQKVYYKKFNKRISKQDAVLELDFLAQIVKLLLANKLVNKEADNEISY